MSGIEREIVDQSLGLLQISPSYESQLTVRINAENRIRQITEPLVVPKNWRETALALGSDIQKYLQIVENFLRTHNEGKFSSTTKSDPILYEIVRGSEYTFDTFIPATDIAVTKSGEWKLLEINTRPASLGSACLISEILGSKKYTDNKGISFDQAIRSFVLNKWGQQYQENTVLISHPNNSFHNQHLSLAAVLNVPVCSLQELRVADDTVFLCDRRVLNLIRQCGTEPLFDPQILDPKVMKLFADHKIHILPGPLNVALGDKSYLRLFPNSEWLPKSQYIKTGEDFNVREFRGCWLKGRSSGIGDITLYLSESMTKGKRREFLESLLRGDYQKAEDALKEIANSNDGKRFMYYLGAVRNDVASEWVIQEDVDTMRVRIAGQDQEMKTVLRVHFVPDQSSRFIPFMQMYADNQKRVNASGFTIPLIIG